MITATRSIAGSIIFTFLLSACAGAATATVGGGRDVGAGYFDQLQTTITGGEVSTAALKDSTEEAQFHALADAH